MARSWVAPLVGLTAALVMVRPHPASTPPRAAAVAPASLRGTAPRDCEACHAREVAQWRGSAMAWAARSPLVGALESLIEEQVGRDEGCPNGAGILRRRGPDACFAGASGLSTTGSGGEHWCVNCHAPGENLRSAMPPWSAHGRSDARAPMRDLLGGASLDGISCAVCHETIGPAHAARGAGAPEGGNPTWTSSATGVTFTSRPEEASGLTGIGNSGYRFDPSLLLGGASGDLGRVHPQAPAATERYRTSSAMCGACHDVRLFGTDVRGGLRGEHFKRLRNAYSEWRAWADAEERAGRRAATCQDCHMSLYPGVCARTPVPAKDDESAGEGCPPGSRFVPRPPGTYATGYVAPSSPAPVRVLSHWFAGADLPMSRDVPESWLEDASVDADGVPLGARARRAILLRHTFRLGLGEARRSGSRLAVPVVLENVGAGHRVPAGFSQEREVWVALRITDARGGVVYEVGRIDRPDEDLRDKRFTRVTVVAASFDASLRPLGLFGADVADGPDVPAWSPDPEGDGTRFLGRGLINLQNGFQRCVRCVGVVAASGRCIPGAGQGVTRADRFADGQYDLDTGECRSNLAGDGALFETYFPAGALDADRGVLKAPDAIVDTRSAPPGVPLTYTYPIDVGTHPAPFTVQARLFFRAFPPYLVRAFAAYEAAQARSGLRPSGAQVDASMLARDEPLEIARAVEAVP